MMKYTKYFSLLFVALFFLSCGNSEDNKIIVAPSSQALVNKQIFAVCDKIQFFVTNQSPVDSGKLILLNEVQAVYQKLSDNITNNNLTGNWKGELIKLHAKCKSSFEGLDFYIDPVTKDLDSLNQGDDLRLKISLNELCLIQNMFTALSLSHIPFSKYGINVQKTEGDKYEICFAVSLDSLNSEISFVSYDSINKKTVPEDTAGIKVLIKHGKYIVLNKNPKTKNGALKFRNLNGTYDYYPFKMK